MMPAPCRCTCHGHTPGGTSIAHSCLVCPQTHPVPPSSLKQPKERRFSGYFEGTSGLLEGSKSRISFRDQGASRDSWSPAPRQSAPISPPLPERLWDRQDLHCLITGLLTHSLCMTTTQDGDAFSLLCPSSEVVQAHRGSWQEIWRIQPPL